MGDSGEAQASPPAAERIDTTWLKAGAVLALWTIASAAATVFKIVADGSRATLAPLYGALRGILVMRPRHGAVVLGDGPPRAVAVGTTLRPSAGP